ncbi:MAG: hypothetical protein AAF587_40830 [Bacteroidota bacterium]
MQTLIPTPPKFVGRSTVRSGPIIRSTPKSGSPTPSPETPSYGVIFSMSMPASADDFTPSDLLGATIENVDPSDKLDPSLSNEKIYFTILGGYFCKRLKKDKKVDISHIFGIAADPSKGFNLQEGNHSIVDEWERDDLYNTNRKTYINEREFGKDGWTFIVNYKPNRHMYPIGCGALKLSHDCPEITALTVTAGALERMEQTVTAQVSTSGGHASKYLWEWGDGTTGETTAPTASHTYQRVATPPVAYTIKVTAKGTGDCESSKTHDFPAPPTPCPLVKFSSLVPTNIDGLTTEVAVALKVTGPMPDEFKWVWKDGTESVTTTPHATHRYTRSFEGDKEYDIKAVGKGPGDCVDRAHCVAVVPKAECPVVFGVQKMKEELTDTHLHVTFKVLVKDPANLPTSFNWFWGDQPIVAPATSAPPEVSKELEISHAYKRPEGDAVNYTVRMTYTQPSDVCADTECIELLDVPGICPILDEVVIRSSTTDGDKQTVSAEVTFKVSDPKPTSYSWDWGDGTPPEVNNSPIHTHIYDRPAGDAEEYTITVSTSGPGSSCDKSVSAPIEIPGVCPVIERIDHEILSQEGNQATVRFTAIISGPGPSELIWNFGDKSENKNSSAHQIEHTYLLPYDGSLVAKVLLSLTGPDQCSKQTELKIEIPGPSCPLLQGLSYTLGDIDMETGQIPVSFELNPGTSVAQTYRWEMGDNSPSVDNQSTTYTHLYDLAYGEEKSVIVKVSSDGPSQCRDTITVVVVLPYICPIVGQLGVSGEENVDGQSYDVTATLPIKGKVLPSKYFWDFGDGSQEVQTTEATVTHAYDRRLGENMTYQIRVRLDGPGQCGGTYTAVEEVPKRCPATYTVSAVKNAETDGEKVPYVFTVSLEGTAQQFKWYWGDGQETSTSEPTATHAYEKQATQKTYPVLVKISGPGDCSGEAETSVTISPADVCPLLGRINVEIEDQEVGNRTYIFAPAFTKAKPDECTWNFGDGSPEVKSAEPSIEHTFPALAVEKEYVVTLNSRGPGKCETTGGKVHVKVGPSIDKPACPEITGIQVLSTKNISQTEAEVSVKVLYKGEAPSKYTWNWESGSKPKITETAQTSLIFQRPPEDAECSINVHTTGPGDCDGDAVTKTKIDGVSKDSFFCRYMRLIVAFLGALSIGAAIICIAAEILDQGEPDWSVGILAYAGLSIFFFGAAIFWWITQGKSQSCKPGRCDWLATGWCMSISALMLTFFMIECFPSWIPWAVVFFISLGVFGFLWFKNCAPETRAKTFFTYFFIAILAGLINMFLIAGPALTCCG